MGLVDPCICLSGFSPLRTLRKGFSFPHKFSRAPGWVKWVFLGKTVSWTEEAREAGRECLWVSLSRLGGGG